MKMITKVILCLFCLSSPSFAADKLTIDHILKLQTPGDLKISPDNEWVAYIVDRNDEKKDEGFSQLWTTSTDGKVTIPLTSPFAGVSKPAWNPDGSSVAFIGKRGDDDDDKNQVWLLDRRGGEARQYTHVKQGVEDFVWSPDGKNMVLIIRDPKPEDGEDNKNNDDKNKEKAKRG
jgi:dipeptidyl aminopeptidase/acylaminoacyl peptidase